MVAFTSVLLTARIASRSLICSRPRILMFDPMSRIFWPSGSSTWISGIGIPPCGAGDEAGQDVGANEMAGRVGIADVDVGRRRHQIGQDDAGDPFGGPRGVL